MQRTVGAIKKVDFIPFDNGSQVQLLVEKIVHGLPAKASMLVGQLNNHIPANLLSLSVTLWVPQSSNSRRPMRTMGLKCPSVLRKMGWNRPAVCNKI